MKKLLRFSLVVFLLAAHAAGQSFLAPIPFTKQQYFDNNGAPLAGGKVCTYLAGTSTPSATYTDSGGGTPNSNPVTLDSAGRASIYFAAHAYKVTLQDSTGTPGVCDGAVVWTQDNVPSLATVAAGGGVVTSFSASGLSGLFTTSVANPTSTPALSFAFSNQSAYTFLRNSSSSSSAPAFGRLAVPGSLNAAYTISCANDLGAMYSLVSGSFSLKLPASPCPTGFFFEFQNTLAGTWTLDPQGGIIDGVAATVSVANGAGMRVFSNGTTWQTQRGSGSGGGGGTGWLVGNTMAGTNATTAKRFFGSSANFDIGLGTNNAEIITLRALNGWTGFHQTTPLRVIHAKDLTLPQIMLEGATVPSWTAGSYGPSIEFNATSGANYGVIGGDPSGLFLFNSGPAGVTISSGGSVDFQTNIASFTNLGGSKFHTFTQWVETATPPPTGTGVTVMYADQVTHTFQCSFNNGSYQNCANVTSNSWNAATSFAGTNTMGAPGFIGTKDAFPFTVGTNSTFAAVFDTSQNFGLGNSSPAYRLDVQDHGNSYMARFDSAAGGGGAVLASNGAQFGSLTWGNLVGGSSVALDATGTRDVVLSNGGFVLARAEHAVAGVTQFDIPQSLDFAEIAAPSTSAAGHAKLYADSSSHTLKCSFNGGAYADCSSGGGGSVTRVVGYTFDGGGSGLATQTSVPFVIPFGCALQSWNISVDAGTATVKVWKKANGTAIPTGADSINTSGVAISSGTSVHSTTLTDFTTTTFTANDIFIIDLSAVATATKVGFTMGCQ